MQVLRVLQQQQLLDRAGNIDGLSAVLADTTGMITRVCRSELDAGLGMCTLPVACLVLSLDATRAWELLAMQSI